MDRFLADLLAIKSEGALKDFCQEKVLHGTPHVFGGDDTAYFSFRKKIADKFEVAFQEVHIVGSAKLGFSPFKRKMFDFDSDVDVAIVSEQLYDRIMASIYQYQMELRNDRKAVTKVELDRYHKFLEYGALGWMRPDKLPSSFRVAELKQDWFEFFRGLSYGKSEIGNYKVNAGAFKSFDYLEKYTISGFRSLQSELQVGESNANQSECNQPDSGVDHSGNTREATSSPTRLPAQICLVE